jgi:hypothetical protein
MGRACRLGQHGCKHAAIVRLATRRQEHQRHATVGRVDADRISEPVHPRHLHVQYCGYNRAPDQGRNPQLFQRTWPVADSRDRQSRGRQLLEQDRAVGGIVVDCKHAQSAQCGDCRSLGCGDCRTGQAHREPECATTTRLAVHANGTTHALHKCFADRQPKACSTELACGGVVRLKEKLEQTGGGFLADTDPGVDPSKRTVAAADVCSVSRMRTMTSPCSVNFFSGNAASPSVVRSPRPNKRWAAGLS